MAGFGSGAAGVEAEGAQARLALMAEATSSLVATLDVGDLLDRLAVLCVPQLADWVVVTLVDESGEVRELVSRDRERDRTELRRYDAGHAQPKPAPRRQAQPRREMVALVEAELAPAA